ncbi:methyltransferase [Nocardioides aurantiacus]|uniref:MerR-like DNA binding protein n=1 Tax=Nocardioides aurantiacus TaxID=86796 RepID=A0A3N2CUK1_9ACTN|nr:methyltransferase [Nocardioides aurantiacus]ROR91088.1 MerR-like DNA binding protein [Nocardioides aurantiacus]
MDAQKDKTRPASWTVGQLAQSSGLSVRMLRHWEDKGLVSADRSASGHRRYGPDQVTRLYRALALRRTGISLTRVAALLDEQDPDPVETLRNHLHDLDHDLRRRTLLRDRLAAVLGSLEDAAPGDTTNDTSDRQAHALMRVIESMTMFEQYVHGYHSLENQRLTDQAGSLIDLLHSDTGYPPGVSVLEVGCGVGAQTVTLAEKSPGAAITCLDISTTSLDEARRRTTAAGLDDITFLQADVLDLPAGEGPLSAGSFDHVFVCFLLEHLADPPAALMNLRSMLKSGGTITVIEGDHGSTYFHPDSQAARDAIACQVTLQRLAGGDALIGRRLYPLLDAAGYQNVAVSPRQVYVDASRPGLVDGFTRKTFTAMIQGVRQAALSAGLIEPHRFDEGIEHLLRTTEADGVFCYTFFKAVATS